MCNDNIRTITGTTDLDELAKHLCCQRNFYHIYQVMEQCNYEELLTLKEELIGYTTDGILHNEIIHKFEIMLREKLNG